MNFVFTFLLLNSIIIYAQNLVPFVKQIGSTFCKYLAMKGQIPRNFLHECGEPVCSWDDWAEAVKINNSKQQRIVLSYAHNGFGNQLWEHTIAFSIAISLRAKLYVAILPENLYIDGAMPPNTFAGMSAMERLLPDEFEFEKLPIDAAERHICGNESFYISDRPRDWRNHNYSSHFKSNIYNFLHDDKPRCLKMVGYFQNYPLCAEDTRKLWTTKMFQNFTSKPGPNDLSIYLRCLPRHYHFNDMTYYETILSRTTFHKLWLFQAPECPTRLSSNPARDGLVSSVIRMLVTKYNASRWVGQAGMDDTSQLLHDLAGLAQSTKLILPVSSWAFWAGLLSNASEIHVNGQPFHPNMGSKMPQYIYHLERQKLYYGRFNTTTNDIEYEIDLNKISLSPTTSPTVVVDRPGGGIEINHGNVSAAHNAAAAGTAIVVLTEADMSGPVGGIGPNNLTMPASDSGFVFD